LSLAYIDEPLPPLVFDKPNDWFEKFLLYMTDCYKIKFTTKDSMNYRQLKRIYEMAVEENFSIIEFRKLIKRFAKNNRFENFTPADFFKIERLNLYPESWKIKKKKKISMLQTIWRLLKSQQTAKVW
jgi:hypothetical protein